MIWYKNTIKAVPYNVRETASFFKLSARVGQCVVAM